MKAVVALVVKSWTGWTRLAGEPSLQLHAALFAKHFFLKKTNRQQVLSEFWRELLDHEYGIRSAAGASKAAAAQEQLEAAGRIEQLKTRRV